MAGQGSRRTILLSVMTILVVAAGGFVYLTLTHEPREVFCTLGMAYIEGDGKSITLEDQGDPGPDDCDGPSEMRGAYVLGLDCKLRAPGGDVVGELEPNQPGGRCGQSVDGSALPESWHSA